MALDEKMLRAAGLPAQLISLLVSITRASERAQVAANNAAVSVDLQPQISAAYQALTDMEIVPGLDTQIKDVSGRVQEIEGLPTSVSDIDIEAGHLVKIMTDGSRQTGPLLPVPDGASGLALIGGALSLDEGDLVIAPPEASRNTQGTDTDYVAIFEGGLQ